MILMYKITHCHTDTKLQIPYSMNIHLGGHTFKLETEKYNTTERRHFFTNRIVKSWNALPENVVHAPSVNSFKQRLDAHWSTTMNIYS